MSMQEEIVVRNALDIVTARMEVREMARRAGLSLTDQAIISMAVYVLANALGLGGFGLPEGRINIESCQTNNRCGVKVHCHKTGQPLPTLSTTYYEKIVDEIDVLHSNPGAMEVVLTMWAKM